jgi:hypothetical protein
MLLRYERLYNRPCARLRHAEPRDNDIPCINMVFSLCVGKGDVILDILR